MERKRNNKHGFQVLQLKQLFIRFRFRRQVAHAAHDDITSVLHCFHDPGDSLVRQFRMVLFGDFHPFAHHFVREIGCPPVFFKNSYISPVCIEKVQEQTHGLLYRLAFFIKQQYKYLGNNTLDIGSFSKRTAGIGLPFIVACF